MVSAAVDGLELMEQRMQGVALRKTATGWEFISEAALEQFVWQNLPEVFGFTPLRQQYRLKDEICDLLALDL